MTIRKCQVVVIEGAHGSGKTTLVHSVAAALKKESVHVGTVLDIARRSPFIEEVALHKLGRYDIHSDLHLFASHIAEEHRAGRQYELLLVDRSLVSVLAYAEIFGSVTSPFDQRLASAMRNFATEYVSIYDLMFFLGDIFDSEKTEDKFRPRERQVQQRARDAIDRVTSELYPGVIKVPEGLTLPERTSFIVDIIRKAIAP